MFRFALGFIFALAATTASAETFVFKRPVPGSTVTSPAAAANPKLSALKQQLDAAKAGTPVVSPDVALAIRQAVAVRDLLLWNAVYVLPKGDSSPVPLPLTEVRWFSQWGTTPALTGSVLTQGANPTAWMRFIANTGHDVITFRVAATGQVIDVRADVAYVDPDYWTPAYEHVGFKQAGISLHAEIGGLTPAACAQVVQAAVTGVTCRNGTLRASFAGTLASRYDLGVDELSMPMPQYPRS